jgi:hypothetical protein
MHGAGGAPKGNTNVLKHGRDTGEAVGRRRALRTILREARQTLADLEDYVQRQCKPQRSE